MPRFFILNSAAILPGPDNFGPAEQASGVRTTPERRIELRAPCLRSAILGCSIRPCGECCRGE